MNRFWQLIGRTFALLFIGFSAISVEAASLENIEVNSRLGESFHAEIPLQLDQGEQVGKTFVEIASASDYKIFEVYRDPALAAIRADVVSDARGVRVNLTSRNAIEAPFFNLIIKLRYGRVSHFKKFPVFLEAAKGTIEAADLAPAVIANGEQAAAPATEPEQSAKPEVKRHDGWARTGRYGPVVRGDMLSTIAQRLRTDDRYTLSQVMAALYEKNRKSFDQQNMNLLMQGQYLDVPMASEVEAYSQKAASELFNSHKKAWQELTQQPRYAAEAEAQRSRYGKRVRIQEQADGVAEAPVAAVADEEGEAAGEGEIKGVLSETPAAEAVAVDAETEAKLKALQEQNQALQQKLDESVASIEALTKKIDASSAAAAEANVKRLELLVARMQGQLEKARADAASASASSSMDWVVWLLIGLVVILLAVVVMLMRREPAHPADMVREERDAETVVAEEAEAAAGSITSDVEMSGIAADETVAPVEAEEQELAPVAQPESLPEVDVDIAAAAEDDSDIFDSISSFDDDLSDSDTAEMEPYQTAAEEPDPNIDYLSEADVYIRYGMEEEALQQLDMALRLDPANVEAHLRKAEILGSTGDDKAISGAKAAAVAALSGAALERYSASVGAESVASESVSDDASDDDFSFQDTDVIAAAAADDDDLAHLHEDFGDDLSHLSLGDDTAEEPEAEVPAVADDGLLSEAEPETGGQLDYDLSGLDEDQSVEVPGKESGESQLDEGPGELDWLHDASFEDEVEQDDEPAEATETIALNIEDGATQLIDSVLNEFEDIDGKDISLEGATIDTGVSVESDEQIEGTIDLADSGATQELDNLLNAFSPDDEPDSELDEKLSLADDDIPAGDQQADAEDDAFEDEMTATQHLDNLLGEFSDDSDMFTGEEEEIAPASADESKDAVNSDAESEGQDDDAEDADMFGATQHLGSLLTEFAENDERSQDHDFIDTLPKVDPVDTDESDDHGATQQLDHLLGAFSTDESDESVDDEQGDTVSGHDEQSDALKVDEIDESEFDGVDFDAEPVAHLETDEIEVDHCATQELDHLLSSFTDDDEDDDEDNSKG